MPAPSTDPDAGVPEAPPESVSGRLIGVGLRRYILVLLSLTWLLNFLDRQVFAILLQPIKLELGASDTQMGLLTGGAFALLYVIAGLPLARMADTGVRKTMIGITLLVWSTMTLGCGLARNFSQILLARMGVAIGEAGSLPSSYSLIPDLYPIRQRSGVVGILYAAGTVGIALSLWLGGVLNQLVGWRTTLAIVAAPGIVLGLLILATVPEPLRRGAPSKHGSLIQALKDCWAFTSFRWIALASGIFSFTGYGVLGWAPTFLIRVHQLPSAKVGLLMGVGMIAGAVGASSAGLITDRLTRRDLRWLFGLGVIGPLISIGFILTFLWAPFGPITWVCYACYQCFFGMWQPGVMSAVTVVAKTRNRGLAVSVVTIFQNIGGVALGPLVVGALNDHWAPAYGAMSIRYSLTLLVVGLVGGLLCCFAGTRTIRRDAARATAESAS